MDRVIYTAMTAASQTIERQAVTANNLANVSTPGFRAQIAALRAAPVVGESPATRVLVASSTPAFDNSTGEFNYTERPHDVALSENGWLAVQLQDGTEAYTRNGMIHIDENGLLRVDGYPLLGENGVLEVPLQSKVTIGTDGTLTTLGAGDEPSTVAQVGRIKRVYIEAHEILRGEDGLFHLTPEALAVRGNELDDNTDVRIMPGVLEGSNVNAAATLIELIAHARHFDMQMKAIQNADENAQRANQMLSMN